MDKADNRDGLEAPQILLRVLLILAIVESNRNNFVLSEQVTRLKDLCLILFCLSMMARTRWLIDTKFFIESAYGWFFLLLILTIPITVYSSTTPFGMEINQGRSISWAFHLRAIYFCVLIYALKSYFSRYAHDVLSLARIFTVACVLFVAFNLVAYFYHFPFMTRFRPQPERISSGYPTSDAQMLLMAITAYGYTLWSGSRKDYLIIGFLVIGVIANLTTSGIAALVLLSCAYTAFRFKERPAKALFVISSAIAAVLVVVWAAYLALDNYFHADLEKMRTLYRFRSAELISLMSGDIGGRDSGTVAVRLDQFTNAYKYNESVVDRLIGIGGFYGYVENQFLHVLVVWGALGLAAFLATIYETYTATVKTLRSAAACFLILWITAGTVLITTYLFPLFVPFAIFAAALMTPNTTPYWNPPTQRSAG